MKASEFDSRLRGILEAEDVPADPEQWNRLAAALPGARVRISRRLVNWMRAVGWAAVLLLALGGGYYWLHQPEHSDTAPLASTGPDTPPVSQQATARPSSPAAPLSNETASSGTSLNYHIPQRSGTPAGQQQTQQASQRTDQERESPVYAYPDPALNSAPPVAMTAPAPAEQRPAPIMTMPRVEEPEPLPMDAPVRRTGGATSLGVAGAYRYGGQNAGYALGVSVRQRLGRKIFVDGDVAYIGTSRSTSTSRMDAETYNRLANPEPGGGGTASRQPLPATKAASLSYVQLAPALSYQVLPALSIGAGPDVQRIIAQAPSTTEDQLVQYDQASAPEYIPAIDWGLSGKAEYSIGNRLRAGIQYRHGLNNALRNEPGITYIERSYMQVQLRVFLLR